MANTGRLSLAEAALQAAVATQFLKAASSRVCKRKQACSWYSRCSMASIYIKHFSRCSKTLNGGSSTFLCDGRAIGPSTLQLKQGPVSPRKLNCDLVLDLLDSSASAALPSGSVPGTARFGAGSISRQIPSGQGLDGELGCHRCLLRIGSEGSSIDSARS